MNKFKSRLKFYLDKANMLAHFIWWREWRLVRDEWNMTYAELEDARRRLPEIEREVLARLWEAIEERKNEEHQKDPTLS